MNEPVPVASTKWTGASRILLAVILLAYVALRCWKLTSYGLWFDEAFSLQAAQMSWGGMMSSIVADIVHPPLFYVVLKIWIAIGGASLLWLKLFSLLISIATVVPLMLLCRELRLSAAETNVAVFLVAVNAFLIHYAQELRMYSLLVFFSLWSFWLFVRWVRQTSTEWTMLICLTVANLLLVYTQYMGWLTIAAEGFYLLVWNRRKVVAFVLSGMAIVLCYLPWAYLIFHASVVEGRGMGKFAAVLDQPRIRDVIWYLATLNGPFYFRRTTMLGVLLFGIPLLWWAWRSLNERSNVFWLLGSLCFVTLLINLIASYVLRPIWTERYLILTAIPYLILIAVAVLRLPSRVLRLPVLALILGWAGFSGIHMMQRGNYRFNWMALTRGMITAEESDKTKVFVFEHHLEYPLQASLAFLNNKRFDVVRVQRFEELQGNHFWMAYRDSTWRREPPQLFLKGHGCSIGNEVAVTSRAGTNSFEGETVTAFPVNCP